MCAQLSTENIQNTIENTQNTIVAGATIPPDATRCVAVRVLRRVLPHHHFPILHAPDTL